MRLPLVGLSSLFIVAAVILCLNPFEKNAKTSITTTMESPGELSRTYGSEVSRIVENYEVDGHTIKMYQDESYHAEVYTGPYLEYIDGYYLSFDNSTPWPIVSEAEVTSITVVEYSAQKIRALACVTEQKLNLDSKSKLISQEPVNYINGAYVFLNVDGKWKLANFLDMSDTEMARIEYSMMDDALKEITGSFKSITGMNCGE
jgi:hypothetical protein